MKKKPPSSKNQAIAAPRQSGWAIGHARFAKISAVEGIAVTPTMKARKAEFDRTGTVAEKRREAIIKTYKR
jgi:hypothetical protein